MPDYTVAHRGTDSSGRGIYATTYMWQWWEAVCRELGFTPTITQGAFMVRNPGGGAADSAGYHDAGGCFDLRVWDLTDSQVDQTIRTLRRSGAAAWLRNPEHGGFGDPHIHLVLGSDAPLAPGASWQWLNYIGQGDGLRGGRDYHWRPTPLVTEPPESLLEDDMPFADWPEKDQTALVNAVAAAVTKRLLDTDLTPKQDEPKSSVRAALNKVLKLDDIAKSAGRRG